MEPNITRQTSTIPKFLSIPQPRGPNLLQWPDKNKSGKITIPELLTTGQYGTVTTSPENILFYGDNLHILAYLAAHQPATVDLIYIDPPYDSAATYRQNIRLKGKRSIAQSKNFSIPRYSDRWKPGAYLQFMYERLAVCRELLKDSGSIFLHCDWHQSHHLRCILDEVFGEKNICNEIIRTYSVGGKSRSLFARKHDTLFFYAKNRKKVYFSPDKIRIPFTPHKNDKSGKNYGGKMGIDEHGNPYVEKWGTGRKKRYRYYLHHGKIPESVWQLDGDLIIDPAIENVEQLLSLCLQQGLLTDDVWKSQTLQSAAKERTGYPTQKPLQLLERIMKACSPERGTILDFFMGSGTAMRAAQQLQRHFIGIDNNMGSLNTTLTRLLTPLDKQGKTQQITIVKTKAVTSPSKADAPIHAHLNEVTQTLDIVDFSPTSLLEKLGISSLNPGEWKKLVKQIHIDWNYKDNLFRPQTIDGNSETDLVSGSYKIPETATVVKICIIDITFESWEVCLSE